MDLILEASLPDIRMALTRKGKLLWNAVERDGRAEIVDELLRSGLQESGCSIADLQRVLVSRGPGSFTGLRVALAFAQGLSFASAVSAAQSLKLHLATTFEILALVVAARGVEGEGVVLLPARRGWYYGAEIVLSKLSASESLSELPLVRAQQMIAEEDLVDFVSEREGWVMTAAGCVAASLLSSPLLFEREELLLDSVAGAIEFFPKGDPLLGFSPNYIEKPQAKVKAKKISPSGAAG